MIPKCSLNGYNTILQFFGLLFLAIILVAVAFYYLRVSHGNILEKYESGTIDNTTIEYKNETDTGNRSTYPQDKYPGAKMELIADGAKSSSLGAVGPSSSISSDKLEKASTNDLYTLRDCKVYFTDSNNIAACDNQAETSTKTCSYKFDGWKEFDSYEDNNGNILRYPKKIYKKDASNTSDLINSYFTSKCFKEFDNNGKGGARRFEYKENNIVKYDSKGIEDNTELDTTIFGGKKYTSIQFMNTNNPSDNLTNVIDSICSIKYNPIRVLTGKTFYKFILKNNNIDSIQKLALKDDQTGFDVVGDAAIKDFSILGSHGLRFENGSLQIFINEAAINANMNIYKFTYVSNLCELAQIKNYIKYPSINIRVTDFIKFGTASGSETKTNVSIGNLDILTNRNNYNGQNGGKYIDYKSEIFEDLEKIRQQEINRLNNLSEDRKKGYRATIASIDSNISEAYKRKNNFTVSNNTFLNVLNLEKRNANGSRVRIFDYATGYVNNLFNNIPIPDGVEATYVNTADICLIFTNNTGQNQKTYTLNVPDGVTYTCDILVVGGGGAGGHFGGGGGGGAVLLGTNKSITGNCSITVGNGGKGVMPGYNWGYYTGDGTINGYNSSITIGGNAFTATGGGGGGTRDGNAWGRNGFNGGSGGGGSHSNEVSRRAVGGNSNKNSYSGWNSYGNNGGKGKPSYYYCDDNNQNCYWRGEPSHASGGGGGSGGNGSDYSYSTGGGNGGLATDFSETFGKSVGDNGFFAGGGGGNTYYNAGRAGRGNGGDSLFGGGGIGGMDWVDQGHNASNGKPNTGGGGGGGRWWWYWWSNQDAKGGDGGSGVVIIKIKSIITIPVINNSIDTYYTSPPTSIVNIPASRIQASIITSFIYLQKGFYRFRADIGNRGAANPNIIYAELVIYDENSKNSSGIYNCKHVFKYNMYNSKYRPSYLKQYLHIPTNKFYKLAYTFYYLNNTSSSFNDYFQLYHKYLDTAPQKLEGSMPSGLITWFRFNGNIADINPSSTKYSLIDIYKRNVFSNETYQNRKFLNTNIGSVKTRENINLARKSFTISTWMRTKNSDHCYFICQGRQNHWRHNEFLVLGSRGNGHYVLAFWGNDLEVNSSGGRNFPEDANTWVHMVFVVDVAIDNNSCSRRMYRNGVEIAKDSGKPLYQGEGVLYIGEAPWHGEGHYRYNMDISDFLIFDRALTIDDVETLYNDAPSETESNESSTYVSLTSSNDNSLFTRNNITHINTPLNDYLYNGQAVYNSYKNANMIKIFSTISYANNSYKNYQELANHLNTQDIDYFDVRLYGSQKNAQQKLIDDESGVLTTAINQSSTIISVKALTKAIKDIDYKGLLPIGDPQLIHGKSFVSIFGNRTEDFITYDKVANLNNLANPGLGQAVYIEALN